MSPTSPPKKLVVPVFIPHQGCPNRCVFCNQEEITGSRRPPTPGEVSAYLASALGAATPHATVAFYGGSFTGLPKSDQDAYLGVAAGFVAMGFASGIRLSTRPDYVGEETARYLAARGVKVVELGVQSMDDAVLVSSGRGHTSSDAVRAAGLIKSAGLELGLQVMAGLPGDTPEGFMETVERVTSLAPDFARIYPTLVVKGSPLEMLWRDGRYTPLGLEEAVALCAEAVAIFKSAGIRVVRVGLQPSVELEASVLAGPYHPSFGHMVGSEIALKGMLDALGDTASGHVEVLVNPSELSVYRGIRSANVGRLSCLKAGLEVDIRRDSGVEKGGLRLNVLNLR